MPAKLCAEIADLTTTYEGFNDVSLTEKLRELHGLEICRELAAGANEKPPAPRGSKSPAALPPGSKPAARNSRCFARSTTRPARNPALGFRPSEDLHDHGTLVGRLCVTPSLPLTLSGDLLNVFVRCDQ